MPERVLETGERGSVCPLCATAGSCHFHRDSRREYLRCHHCLLVYVPEASHLSLSAEHAEYLKHENSPLDSGYRRFLDRLVAPMLERVPAGAQGLDFGCGPGPALSTLFAEAGCTVCNYDPFFCHDPELLQRRYDFVCATEVIEHLRKPAETLEQIWKCVAPGGNFGAMSKLVLDQQAFARWHYKNDPTHISFFSRETLTWLASKWQATLEFVADDAFIFSRSHTEPPVNGWSSTLLGCE